MNWKGMIWMAVLGVLMLLMACGEDEPMDDTIPVSYLSIGGDFITDGSTSQLTAAVSPADATNQAVEWTVSNESVATITQEGLLSAVSNGIVTVTVAALDGSGVTANKSFQVSGVEGPKVPVASISIVGNDITDGKSLQLSAEVLPANADNKMVEWMVSDASIAEISPEGLLSPKLNGSIVVTATATDESGVTGTLEIEISGVNTEIDGLVIENETDLLNALANANAGDKIYIRGGVYSFSSTVRLDRNGEDGNVISLLAYPGDAERPKFDFSAMSEDGGNRGIQLSGSYWHVKDIDVFNAGDNGMFIRGHSNLVEFCTFSENADSGLQIGNGASGNTVLNCDSFFNADSSIENADGFACKLDAGDGNRFVGCRAWQNLDDGWDGYLRGSDNITTVYENCWAIRNGILKDGTVGGGDGNGFKTGGSDDKLLKHHAVFKNCIAYGNVVDGFDHNSNRGEITIYNCAAHDNGRNINFGSGNIAGSLTVKNSVSLGGAGDNFQATVADISHNSWQNGLQATSSDFVSLDAEQLLGPRKADGSLPDIQYLHLVSSSNLIDQGQDVGLPYNGSAPDLGAFEYQN